MNTAWSNAVERALRVEIADKFGVAPHRIGDGKLVHPITGTSLSPVDRSSAISIAAGVIFAEHHDPVEYEETRRMKTVARFATLVRHTATTFDVTLHNRIMFSILDAYGRSSLPTRPSRKLDDAARGTAAREKDLKASLNKWITPEKPGWTTREREKIHTAKTYGDLRTLLVGAERRRIVNARKKD